MLYLGLEPGAAGCKVQKNPLSYVLWHPHKAVPTTY